MVQNSGLFITAAHEKKSECPRFYVREDNLQTQVSSFLGLLTIKQHYIDWFIKWIAKKNEDKVKVRDARRNQLEKTLTNVNIRIDNLLKMKLSPDNINGSLVTDEEYQSVREKLLKEKQEMENGLASTERHFEEIDELLVKTFSLAAKAKEILSGKDMHKKKILLQAIGANLTIKNKEVDIMPRYPFERIKEELASAIPCETEDSLLEQANPQSGINWGG